MIATIYGLFGITDSAVAGQMTLYEYRLRYRGYSMKWLERERELYLQAYLNRTIKATDRSGKRYVFKEFSDFYDEIKRKSQVLGGSFAPAVDSDLIRIAKRMKHYKGGMD